MPPVLLGLLLALLPLAVLSGWFVGRRSCERSTGRRVSQLSSSYFKGLNYLLNEQPDKAIEVFLQIAEVDKDTVETHFALGNLFRRRGEVDRAIRIHQNLIERPKLSEEQRLQAVLELGEDFLRAGLLDRAGELFRNLGQIQESAPAALRHLLWIDQQERDWVQGIEHARRYEVATGEPMGRQLAHFHCELAETAREAGDLSAMQRHLHAAWEADSHNARVGVIQGRIALGDGGWQGAAQAFERVARHDVDALPQILDELLEAWQGLKDPERARTFLAEMIERSPGISPTLALARLIEQDEGAAAAADFLQHQLERRPSIRALNAWIDLARADPRASTGLVLDQVRELTGRLVASATVYRCTQCGFGARAPHWQCPSCKQWDTVKPVHDAFGE